MVAGARCDWPAGVPAPVEVWLGKPPMGMEPEPDPDILEVQKRVAHRPVALAPLSTNSLKPRGSYSSHMRDRVGSTVLHDAARLGDLELVQQLVTDDSVDVDALDYLGRSALDVAKAACLLYTSPSPRDS